MKRISGNILKLTVFFLVGLSCLVSCSKDSQGGKGNYQSYSLCPIQVIVGFDYCGQVDYSLSGNYVYNYSCITVCLRRLNSSGYPKAYNEITDTRDNPNAYQTYHTYKKLAYDETGVKLYWVELTRKDTGEVLRYVNYY